MSPRTDKRQRFVNQLVDLFTEDERTLDGAEARARRLLDARDEAVRQRDACVQATAEQLAAAESRVADLGWRKNRLVEAIEARGYTVRWGRDGRPTLTNVLASMTIVGPAVPEPEAETAEGYYQRAAKATGYQPNHKTHCACLACVTKRARLDAALRAELERAGYVCDVPGCVAARCVIWQGRPWKA